MSLTAGSHLGPYEILSPLGAGGMGVVYKARDTRLGREVAIKVLPESLSGRADLRERFEREARAVSSLNHPHICTLYDIGNQDGIDFLVMEYLEGETLAHRLKKGALPLDQTLRYAIEIASALDAAHRKGITHRDLKPGNVMLKKSGTKLLDFGLARMHAPGQAAGSAVATQTETLTVEGNIVGTLQYMAPEQLEGKDADARSDIFAFGAVVYEMATGRKAFESKSRANLIASILEHEPAPILSLQPAAPAALDRVIETCLAKDPDERWQTTHDLKRELQWVAESTSQVGAGTVAKPIQDKRPSRHAAAVLTLVGVLAIAAFAGYRILRRPAPAVSQITLGRTTQVTFDPGLNLDPALSPDGKLLAYSPGPMGQTNIYVRQLGAARNIMLTQGVPGYHRWPQWSPDGSQIAFFSVNLRTGFRMISIVPSLGGVSKPLIEEESDPLGGGLCCPTWSPDGARIAYASGNRVAGSAVYVLALAESGAAKIVEHPFATHSLVWSPDGTRIAYVVENSAFIFGEPQLGNIAPSAIWLAPAVGGRAVQVTDRVHLNMSPAWAPDSKHLLFISDRGGRRDLYEVALLDSGEPAGPPALLTTGLNALNINLSKDGAKLAYSMLNHEANIWSIGIPPRPPASISAATPVTTGSQRIEGIGVSHDGHWLAFDSSRSGKQGIYRMALVGGEMEQLTANPGDDFIPSWSPDGKEIAFYSWRNGNRDLFLMTAKGRSERQLTSAPGHEFYPDWSPDGKQIVFWSLQRGRDTLSLLTRSVDGAGWEAPQDLVSPGGTPRWSPDGRLIAYV